MDARTAADLIRFMEQAGIEVYVDGGWAVDALLGRQTRVHDDLDIALPHQYVPRLRASLAARGFRDYPRDDAWECNFVLADDHGCRLDVHSYTLDDAGNNIYGVAYIREHLARVAREVSHRLRTRRERPPGRAITVRTIWNRHARQIQEIHSEKLLNGGLARPRQPP